MQKQHTLAGPASLAGVSLHTGEKVTLTIHPAPVNHGFKFRRTDLKDQPTVDALAGMQFAKTPVLTPVSLSVIGSSSPDEL